MFTRKCIGVGISLVAFVLMGGAATGFDQTVPAEQPSPDVVAKLVAQLGAADLRTREQAGTELEKFGGPVLPALRKAAKGNLELEVKRRIEVVVGRIETALLKVEEKRWQDLDTPRRSIKDRVIKILANSPKLNDQQVTSAIYLLSVARTPTDEELAQAKKQFAESDGQLVSALQLARSLVQGKEFKAEVAGANVRLQKAQKDLATGENMAKMLHRLNGPEFIKLTEDLGASLNKTVESDEKLVDVAFLMAMSRYPKASETKSIVAHLKKAQQRSTATTDMFWALMNTKEFLITP